MGFAAGKLEAIYHYGFSKTFNLTSAFFIGSHKALLGPFDAQDTIDENLRIC